MRVTFRRSAMLNTSSHYKPSRFNARTTAPDGSLVICNTFSGHACVVSPSGANPVKRYLSRLGWDDELDDLGRYLLNNGYLVHADTDELAKWDISFAQFHYRTDALRLVLFASEDCNFRCIYCSQPFRFGSMLPSVRTGIRKFVEQKLAKLRYLSISWFGGEPLLGYEAISDLAPYFAYGAKKHAVRYRADMTTNGYLLTPERTRELLAWDIKEFQITVDGLRDQHDVKRPLKDGGPTFDRIMENLKGMHALRDDFEVRLRVNFDRDNIERLPEYFRFLKEVLSADPRFKIGFNAVGQWGGPNDSKLKVLTSSVYCQQHELRAEAQQVGLPSESLKRFFLRPGAQICHGTLLGGLNIGADGRLFKCTNHGGMGDDPNVIGRICESGAVEIDTSRQIRWIAPYYRSDTQCCNCFYLPICQGGDICVAARVKGVRPSCPQEKLQIRRVLLDYWEERKRESESLKRMEFPTRNVGVTA